MNTAKVVVDCRDVLTIQIYRLVSVVRSVQIKRAVTDCQDNPDLNFWRVIYGNLLDIAVLEWCKVFGTDSEPTHWKKIVPAAEHDAFRSGMLVALGVTMEDWVKYREHLKRYRDEHVSHLAENSTVTNYPLMDNALKACYYYYGYLIQELRKPSKVDGFPDDLAAYAELFLAMARRIAAKAIDATNGFEEIVR